MFKRIITAAAALVLSISAVGCGNGGSSAEGEAAATTAQAKSADGLTDKDKEDIQKAKEELSDKDKQELDDLAKELEGGTESKADAAPAEKYAPKQEILDADFDSGLVQIGDDIFKCGGYIKLGDFVQQYGDRWEWDNISNGQYADINALLAESVDTVSAGWQHGFTFKNKNDPELSISVQCIPYKMNVEGHEFRTGVYKKAYDNISDLIVFDIYADYKSDIYEYYPKGVKRYRPVEPDASSQITDETVKEFFNNNFGIAAVNDKTSDTSVTNDANYLVNYKYMDTVHNFDDSNCFNFCGTDSITAFGINNSAIKEYAVIKELKDDNLLGYKPSVACAVIINTENKSAFSYYSMQLTKSDDYRFFDEVPCNGNLVVARNIILR